jgi:hypothetical protein
MPIVSNQTRTLWLPNSRNNIYSLAINSWRQHTAIDIDDLKPYVILRSIQATAESSDYGS